MKVIRRMIQRVARIRKLLGHNGDKRLGDATVQCTGQFLGNGAFIGCAAMKFQAERSKAGIAQAPVHYFERHHLLGDK